MKGIKVESAENEIQNLNIKFYNKQLLDEAFYRQLTQAGVDYQKSVLTSLVPDSSNTYFGLLIRQDGQVFEFDLDLDLDDNAYSIWKNVTDSFKKEYKKNKKNKLWLEEIVGYDFFRDMTDSR